ncbi:MAG: glycoside hydrolase family 97 protein [Bacteroidales bacterium]|nr:glycoside hydrolase family 97 protein [Bacteroidales bacterium]
MRKLISFVLLFTTAIALNAAEYEVTSPDGKVHAKVSCDKGTRYSLSYEGHSLIVDSPLSMTLDDGTVLGASKVRKVSRQSVDETIKAMFYRKAVIDNVYNELNLDYGTYNLVLRVYDDGFAFRWESDKRKPYKVVAEQATFNFVEDWNMYATYTHKYAEEGLEAQYMDDFENLYKYTPLSKWDTDHLGVLPLMVDCPANIKLVIAESDLVSYPGMFLYNGDSDKCLEGKYAPYPKTEVLGGHNMLQMMVKEREDYLASCDGEARTFPWRSISISTQDVRMADNDMVYRLARPCPADEDYSWVKPGKVAWEWWNNWNVRGVDFVAGINTETYKYYIDFASRHGLEYVILDEGWAVKYADDLFAVVPEIDMPALVKYAEGKNVGIILWAGYSAFMKDIENVCRHYAGMGVKGFKVDFLDRNDQKMEDFIYKASEIAAKYRLVMDFHGCHQPTGLQRRFPNILNYEGIFGLEQMRKRQLPEYDMVEFDVTIPYIRYVAGFADYTPGAMKNGSYTNFRDVRSEPMSQGTRCRQLAQFVVFDAPLNMICDSPTNYELEPLCSEFLYKVPTVWDETVILDGKVGDYIVTARRKGDTWYIGAMTDWTERDLRIDISRLVDGEVRVDAWQDGKVAHKFGNDYQKKSYIVKDSIDIHLAPGGGWAAIVTHVD